MVQCSFCPKESVHYCSQCHKPICREHGDKKDFIIYDNYFQVAESGYRPEFSVVCKTCHYNFLSWDWLKYFLSGCSLLFFIIVIVFGVVFL